MLTIIFFWFDARRISRGMGATAFLARFGRKRTDAVFTLCRNCSRNKMIKINLAKFMDAHGFIMRAPWLMLSRSKWPKEKKMRPKKKKRISRQVRDKQLQLLHKLSLSHAYRDIRGRFTHACSQLVETCVPKEWASSATHLALALAAAKRWRACQCLLRWNIFYDYI